MKYSERSTVSDFLNAHDSTFKDLPNHQLIRHAFLMGCTAGLSLSEKAFKSSDFYGKVESLVDEVNKLSDEAHFN